MIDARSTSEEEWADEVEQLMNKYRRSVIL